VTTTVPAPKPAPRYAPPAAFVIPPSVDRLTAFIGDLDERTAQRIHDEVLASTLADGVQTWYHRALRAAIVQARAGGASLRVIGRCDRAVATAAGVGDREVPDAEPWITLGDVVEDAAHALLVGDHLPVEARDALLAPVVAAGFKLTTAEEAQS
jgi:hypothetical protein